jgi:predicted amidophosphoribosyltransferase
MGRLPIMPPLGFDVLDALEVLFPRECLVCQRPVRRVHICSKCVPPLPGQALGEQSRRCASCFSSLERTAADSRALCDTCTLFPSHLNRIRFIWEYGGLPRDLIKAMKYRPSIILTRHCGRILSEAVRPLFGQSSWDVVVPVAPSPASYKKRMFNPCALMAHEIARTLPGRPPVRDHLCHARGRPPQASLTHEERIRGLKELFFCHRPRQLAGKRVLMVEDVITTGATTSAAAFVLGRAGASSVDVIALARAHVWSRYRARLHRIFG